MSPDETTPSESEMPDSDQTEPAAFTVSDKRNRLRNAGTIAVSGAVGVVLFSIVVFLAGPEQIDAVLHADLA